MSITQRFNREKAFKFVRLVIGLLFFAACAYSIGDFVVFDLAPSLFG